MAVELTPLGKVVVGIFKWVVVPACAAFIGFALIGPRIGGRVADSMNKIPGVAKEKPQPKTAPAPKPSKRALEFEKIRERS
jgi:hypothetical protein